MNPREPIACPHCGEPTQPNRLADGTVVCSCAAERDIGAPDAPAPRMRDPEHTRRAIIDAATAEFSEHGLAGARVDAIAARTRTTKRMIYYYFGGKAQLYAAVIEEAYGGIRDAERDLRLDVLPPLEAMRRYVEFTFDYHGAHPDFVRLVSIENIHRGRYLQGSGTLAGRNAAVIEAIAGMLARGVAGGVFRADADPLDVHLLISAFCFYRVSNRHTLARIFGRDLGAAAVAAAHRRMLVEAVQRYLAP